MLGNGVTPKKTVINQSLASWDPTLPVEHKGATLSSEAKRRAFVEMMEYVKQPPHGIYIHHDEQDISKFHALVVGPEDTPYQGGFFYFYLRIPPNYPWSPPKVKLMTTGGGKVRFGPNLYNNGKVCLSILGTWAGPSWSPSMTIVSVLLSVQSLMNDEPYYNEPSYEDAKASKRFKASSDSYSENIRFETMRVAVLDMLEENDVDEASSILPQTLKEKMLTLFKENYQTYEKIITDNLKLVKFNYNNLHRRLLEHKVKLGLTKVQ